MNYKIQKEGKFEYIESGRGEVLLLLHGLFGAMSNFVHVVDDFSKKMKVSIPLLPLFKLPVKESTLDGLVAHIEAFVRHKNYRSVTLLGNSLGGHIALLFAIANPSLVRGLVLTGSSGLFESSLGDSYPKKGDYEYVKKKTEYTFYDPKVATKELVDEVYEIVNDREKAIRVISFAKSAMRHNLRHELHQIEAPTLLIWGKDDNITPPFVGEEFQKLLPNAELQLLDRCGHAPMMERPEAFNRHLETFLNKLKVAA